MMTRGKARVVPAVPSVPGVRSRKRAAKSAKQAKGAPTSKRAQTGSPAEVSRVGSDHPSQLVRRPITSDREGTSKANTQLDIAVIVSGAVVEGLKVAGIIKDTQGSEKEDANPAVSVQESVAAVIQDIAGENNPPLLDSNNSIGSNSLVTQHMAEANDRPQILHTQIGVPLASRISEKIQSKIWANEYIDLGTLLHRISPSDYKYNFVVQTTQSNDRPVISLEPAQKAKRIIAIDQWITAFQTFVAIYTVRFPKDTPALMKYSETVRDLTAKNAHWRYYDENFRFLRQKTLFPWDQIHWELWLQAHHMQKAAPVASSDARNKNLKSPFLSGYCWKFHRGEKCSGCNFSHECFKCGSQHPANKCAFPKRISHPASTTMPRTAPSTAVPGKPATQSRPVSSNVNTNQSR